MADGTWTRLKACCRDICGSLFFDRSHNRPAAVPDCGLPQPHEDARVPHAPTEPSRLAQLLGHHHDSFHAIVEFVSTSGRNPTE